MHAAVSHMAAQRTDRGVSGTIAYRAVVRVASGWCVDVRAGLRCGTLPDEKHRHEGTRPVSTPTQDSVKRSATIYTVVAVVLLLVGIGAFGTASSGEVKVFGLTMEAKYACALFFLLGAVFAWAANEARRRGGRP